MNRLVVSGFASLDYPLGLDGFARANTTTRIAKRSPRAWPRVGGCPGFVAMAAARAGAAVSPLTWVGSDAEGRRYLDDLAAAGADTTAIAFVPSERSPASVLVYQADGSCICLYDAGFAGRERLSAAQRAALAQADHVCLTVGPAHLAQEILDARRADARLYWVLKNDPAGFPPTLRRRLSAEADVIFCNQAERTLVGAECPPAAVIVETHGAREVVVTVADERIRLGVTPIEADDTTGAGDTLAGGYIAAAMTGQNDPAEAARAGIRAVADLLRARQTDRCEDA